MYIFIYRYNEGFCTEELIFAISFHKEPRVREIQQEFLCVQVNMLFRVLQESCHEGMQ